MCAKFFERSSGVLLHPTSLPGEYGIGTLGKSAYKFVDFLKKSEQKLWQMFPLGPTGYGNSPYQCFSAFAGNPLLIDLEQLILFDLLSYYDLDDIPELSNERVDYAGVIAYKIPLLKKAGKCFIDADLAPETIKRVNQFESKNAYWLDDYAFFMALKDHFGGGSWSGWEMDIRRREPEAMAHYRKMLEEEIQIQKYIQYLFFKQWFLLKRDANYRKIKIIGDLPIFVAFDSADVWSHPELFDLDDDLMPRSVAGVPPDYFCKTGQLWGNPLYNWDYSKQTGFSWWIERIKASLKMYDIIRIDHFRGFTSCWSVPAQYETAVHGHWEPAAGAELFEAVAKELGELPIIAEDLGVITPEVEQLRDSNGFPGMKILQFAFDSKEDNDFLPHNYTANSVVYTGTHDNDTALGWYQNASPEDKKFARAYLDCRSDNFVWKLIRTAWASPSGLSIVPLQDLLELGNEARTNMPGSASGNWEWRFGEDVLSDALAFKLRGLTRTYRRSTPLC